MGMGVEPSWIDVDGVRTRYFAAGSGEPILLITGGNFGSPEAASTVETWDRNFLPLSRRYRVIAIDKLGQGHTGNPVVDDDYTMQAVIRHIVGFIGALGLENLHVVGQSRGGMPTAAVTRLCPERIRSLTIVNSSTLAPGIGLNEVALAGCPYPSGTRDAQRWLFQMCAFNKAIVTDDFVEAGYEVIHLPKYQESCRKMEVEGLKQSRFIPQLAKLKGELLDQLAAAGPGRPTQIVWGANDRTATLDRALSLYQLIASRERQASFTVINQAGHHPYREHPEQFNEIMFGFLGALQ